MGKITPEELIQDIKEFLLEDLNFDPSQVQRFFTSNIFTRTLSHIVGWTGREAKMLRCTSAGELKTAPTTTGIENYFTATGNAGDAYATIWSSGIYASRFDVFIWDNPGDMRFSTPGGGWGYGIEVPPGFYSVDLRATGVQMRNKTAGQVARYQLVGWY